MNESLLVGAIQAFGDCDDDADSFWPRQLPLGNPLGQTFSVNQLGDDVAPASLSPRVEDGHDPRVLELGDLACFFDEAVRGSGEVGRSSRGILIATWRRSCGSHAFHTSAKPPAPSNSWSS